MVLVDSQYPILTHSQDLSILCPTSGQIPPGLFKIILSEGNSIISLNSTSICLRDVACVVCETLSNGLIYYLARDGWQPHLQILFLFEYSEVILYKQTADISDIG